MLASAAINAGLLLLPFLLLEGLFRLLPVASLPEILPVNAETPVARFRPNVDYVWSRDWNFSIVARKRSNNYGFVHAEDYRPHATTPLLAVIGDSFVEAQQVDSGKSVAELIHASGGARTYSFAMSGAPLSQYLVYAEYARRFFAAQAMAIVIAINDFDESLLELKPDQRRFHAFAEDGTLERLDYELSATRKVLRQSAVLRFVMYNLEAGLRLDRLVQALRGNAPSAALDGEALERRVATSRKAVDFFLDQLPARSGLPREAVVFVVDPPRPAIYTPEGAAEAERGFYGRIEREFVREAGARGYEVIELAPVFQGRHRLDGSRFEAGPTDSHWSALGHRVVATEIMKSRVYTRLVHEDGWKPPAVSASRVLK
jgi:hypothetical protein